MSERNCDTAQICLNGHVINSAAESSPQFNRKHCMECGALTITACPQCHAQIPGRCPVPGDFRSPHYKRPNYCPNCGRPYPWITASLDAARELVDGFGKLSNEERRRLKECFPDLIQNTPRRAVAETHFRKLVTKAGKEACDGMKAILAGVVSEAVQKSLFGG